MSRQKVSDNKIFYRIMRVLLLFVMGGIFGFVYELLFYRIDLGYFEKRGITFGPWITIYGFGALAIFAVTYKLKSKPLLVVLLGGAVCGLIEFTSGYILNHLLNIRLWNYNNEIWNWGNIGGYICIRSVLFFATSSLLCVYVLYPLTEYLHNKLSKKLFCSISILSGSLFIADSAISAILNL